MVDIEYIERILKLRQSLIEDGHKNVEVIDRMFENFMELNYKIKMRISLDENIYDIMSRILKTNEM
jgi:hypothetical protein